ncbi:MAG: MaoC family dehydratase [Betaproteobacteria bacterium]
MRVNTPGDLRQYKSSEVAVSDWVEVTQEMIDGFAESTGDFQWIHVDTDRAESESVFGSTIAHGFLTLSLLSKFLNETIDLGRSKMGINYGLNRVRFTAPVRVDSRLRARFYLEDVVDIPDGVQLVWAVTIEIEGGSKPALVAEWLTRRYG